MQKIALFLCLASLAAAQNLPTGKSPNGQATPIGGNNPSGNLTVVQTDASGNIITAPPSAASATQVQGTAANGAATVGNPVYICGLNAANCKAIAVDASGNIVLSNLPATVDTNTGTASASTVRVVPATNLAFPTSTGAPLSSNAAGGIQDTGAVSRAVATRPVPSSSSSDAIAPSATSAAASNLVLKGSAGNLYSVQLSTGATAGLLMVFDATAAPVDGAVTPKYCTQIAANSTVSLNWSGPPASFATGITAVFSSGTNCFSKTASATAFISGQAQ